MTSKVEQPNGQSFRARAVGDEWANAVETASGYTILEGRRGRWEYAEKTKRGRLRPSGAVVGRDDPPGRKHLRDEVQVAAATELKEETAEAEPLTAPWVGEPSRSPSIGPDNSLVILTTFNDQTSLGTTAAQWNAKYFGANNSVAHYYDEVSYGLFSIVPATESHGTPNDGVVGWINVNMNHPNTTALGDSNRTATKLAIQAADPFVNYAAYDTNGDGYVSHNELHITVIAAGQEASCFQCRNAGKHVWGHRWSLWGTVPAPSVDGKLVGAYGYTQFGEMHYDHQAAIGIMVHEIGHDLDWPDLYDTDSSSEGIGVWSVMAAGSWAKTASDAYAGDTPPHPDSWSKWFKGWLTPQTVTGTETKQINAMASVNETNTAVRMLENPSGAQDWTWQGGAVGEYFLVENRQRIAGTYDESLPGNGLLVLHINEANGNNATDTNRLVDVEEADGLGELNTYGDGDQGDAGDLYPGSSNNRTFNDASNPNSKLISGAASGVAMSNVSDSGTTMSACFSMESSTNCGGTAPANDNMANATTISNRTFTATVNNSSATWEAAAGEDFQPVCADLDKTVWFKYVPTRDVRVKVDTQNSNFDTVLNVWRGTAYNNFVAQGCNDDVEQGVIQYSRVPEFVANAGQTYYFQAGGFYDQNANPTTATGSLTFNFNARPVNDDYANAQVISGTSGTVTGNNANGTKETNEPLHGTSAASGGASVWYRWTAPSNGTVTFDTLGTAFTDTVLESYTGSSVTGPSVAENDDIDGINNRKSRISFAATSGTVYSIAVDGFGSTDRGELSLNWNLAQPASANLGVDKGVARNGDQLTYTITVTNGGPDAAQAVTVTDTLPGKVSYVSATPSTGTCSGTATVTCNLGSLANQAQATVTIVTNLNGSGTISNTASASSSTTDPAPGNNSDSADITIEAPPATDLSVTGFVDDIFAGSPDFLYTFLVERTGAEDGSDVQATFQLPKSVRYVMQYDTGDCSGTGTITCNFGQLAVGGTHQIEIRVTPKNPGPHIATGAVAGGDANPGNDEASAVASIDFVCDNSPTAGNDKIKGTADVDVLCGLKGNDTFKGLEGDDLMFGGGGNDTVVYAGSPHPVIVNLNFQGLDAEGAWPRDGVSAAHGWDNFTGIERAKGSSKDDHLLGRSNKGDKLWGAGGKDLISGYGGSDTLNGGGGDDDLYGGKGFDYLKGGKGSDLCRNKSDSRKGCER